MTRLTLACFVICGACITACASHPDVRAPADLAATEGSGRHTPSATELLFLSRMATLPANQPARIGGYDVVASPAYDSASGYRCRRVMMGRGGEEQSLRLACGDAQGWFFAPAVVGGGGGDAP